MTPAATLRHDAELAPSAAPLDPVLSSMAHDLRQPLSNIEAIAYHLSMILPESDEKAQAQLRRIRELVQQTDEIISGHLRQPAATQVAQSAAAAGA